MRVEAKEAGQNDHKVRYGVRDADPDAVPLVYTPQESQVVQEVDLGSPASLVSERLIQGQSNEAPAFGSSGYAFDLAENADGSTTRVALGTVSATDPESATVSYSIVGGNDADLFEIDAATGALSYKGTGEDHESGTTSYSLTVRASDGTLHADARVTVSVTDVAEAPAFGESSYAFDLAEKRRRQHDPCRAGHGMGDRPGGRHGELQHRRRQRRGAVRD